MFFRIGEAVCYLKDEMCEVMNQTESKNVLSKKF